MPKTVQKKEKKVKIKVVIIIKIQMKKKEKITSMEVGGPITVEEGQKIIIITIHLF